MSADGKRSLTHEHAVRQGQGEGGEFLVRDAGGEEDLHLPGRSRARADDQLAQAVAVGVLDGDAGAAAESVVEREEVGEGFAGEGEESDAGPAAVAGGDGVERLLVVLALITLALKSALEWRHRDELAARF